MNNRFYLVNGRFSLYLKDNIIPQPLLGVMNSKLLQSLKRNHLLYFQD